ncbi:MAG: peptidase M14 [Alphaproteobacteria bacterium]|nr:peptidase M14 [Alphaproteobacteria bacterium]
MAAKTQAKTRVFSDVDYERKGKQATVLRVPQSRNDSGWGVVQIPITVLKNGKGPTVLLTGGVHGDEYESQIAISELARTLEPSSVQGRLIIIPALHYPAAVNGTRLSPIDNKDLNRCFPGRPEGTFADVLAHYVTEILLPITDVNLDLHSGGRAMEFVPSTTAHVLDDRAKMAETEALALAFGAPYHVVIKEVDAGYTFMTTCERRGVTAISSELGGGNRVSIPGLASTRRGIMNALKHLGVIRGKLDKSGPKTRVVTVPDYGCYAFAPQAGLFEAYHPLGAKVRKGEAAGALHFIDDPHRKPIIIDYGYSGELWCTRGQGQVSAGDPVAVLVAVR